MVPANDVLCASGTKLQVRGKTTVALTLETDLTLHQQMPVADLQVDGALGLDFMKNHPCVIDVCNNHLEPLFPILCRKNRLLSRYIQ